MHVFLALSLLSVAVAKPSRFLSSSPPGVASSKWPTFIWFKQGHGDMKFDTLFGDVQKGQVTAEKLILATVENAADEANADKNGMLKTFGAEGSSLEVYIRPDYTQLASYLGSKQSCTSNGCQTSDLLSYLDNMVAGFRTKSGLTPIGIACQQEEGFDSFNQTFKCPELMVGIDRKYKFLQIESGFGCYSVQQGATLRIATPCEGASNDCLCPTHHLEEKTYEPYVIGGFKSAPSGHDCKNSKGNYCCTHADVPDAKCPDWDLNNQCFMKGDEAGASYGKLIGMWWKSDASFPQHPEGHVSCIGVGSQKAYGNANCAIDPASAPSAAKSLQVELGPDAKALCFY